MIGFLRDKKLINLRLFLGKLLKRCTGWLFYENLSSPYEEMLHIFIYSVNLPRRFLQYYGRNQFKHVNLIGIRIFFSFIHIDKLYIEVIMNR